MSADVCRCLRMSVDVCGCLRVSVECLRRVCDVSVECLWGVCGCLWMSVDVCGCPVSYTHLRAHETGAYL
eukprot:1423162-Pyramimonas_sp.AAC.2